MALIKEMVFRYIVWESDFILIRSRHWPLSVRILLIKFIELKYKFTYFIYSCKHTDYIYVSVEMSMYECTFRNKYNSQTAQNIHSYFTNFFPWRQAIQ